MYQSLLENPYFKSVLNLFTLKYAIRIGGYQTMKDGIDFIADKEVYISYSEIQNIINEVYKIRLSFRNPEDKDSFYVMPIDLADSIRQKEFNRLFKNLFNQKLSNVCTQEN